MKEALREIYTDVKNTGSFGGVEKLFRAGKKKGLNITRKSVKFFLSSNQTYGMHKQKKNLTTYHVSWLLKRFNSGKLT